MNFRPGHVRPQEERPVFDGGERVGDCAFVAIRRLSAEAYLLSAGAAVDVFGLRSNEIPDAVRESVIQEYPGLGFKREFAGLLRTEAKQVPRGRAWYLHRFAMSDLSIRLAPFRD
jgi:hypothetical protein